MRLVLYTLVASLLWFYTPTGVDFVFQDYSAHAAVKRPPPPPPKPKPKIKRTEPKAISNLRPTAKRNPLKNEAVNNRSLKPNFRLPKGKKVNLNPSSLKSFKATKDVRSRLLNKYGTKPKAKIPRKAYNVLNQIKTRNGAPPNGYKGQGKFKNDSRGGGQILPRAGPNGKKITYKEYDVNKFVKGRNRGAERIVVGSNGRAYYTNNHYKTFTEMK
ncbi:ribonuclease domain-containing protein [Marinobacter maritimus]|uniref:ribonuclease domain-containing protein n=1 Tax=Marinobacter maritimus TaxID=277961 RepID=UPI0011AB0F35|nr:ribonuclease domain-containing protein [Marinobacter maritimus]